MTTVQANDLLTWTGAIFGMLVGIWFTLLLILAAVIRTRR